MATMPYGKHKGKALSALPADYIKWCLSDMEHLREPLRVALTAELERRESTQSEPGDERANEPADEPSAAPRQTATAEVSVRARALVRTELSKVLRKMAAELDRMA